MSTYLNAINTIISTEVTSINILFSDVNSRSDIIPPIKEEATILGVVVLLLSKILTDVITMASIMILNKKNKSIYIFIY
jgi:hypothetical protein